MCTKCSQETCSCNTSPKGNTREKLAVMQAFLDGQPIQCKLATLSDPNWTDCDPMWNWGTYDYRVKPEPRDIWVIESRNPTKPESRLYSSILFYSREDAEKQFRKQSRAWPDSLVIVHYREVLP
jgi:hypothetical protein